MKNFILILLLIFLLSVTIFAQSQYRFFSIGFVGISNITFNQLAGNESAFFDSSVWGINGRLKFSRLFGFAFDLFYVGKQYYWVYTDGALNNYYYGPVSWDIASQHVLDYYTEDTWEYYHEEFYANVNLGLYLPIAFLQLYFECGPSFFFTRPGPAADYDAEWLAYYRSIYGEGGFTVGLNFKIGIDFFINRSISIGAFMYFLEPSFESFFEGMRTDTWDYIGNHGYLGIELMIWL